MFTLIICAYNEDQYLSQTLETLSNQSDNYFNLVLVDNNSTDTTRKIMTNFQKLNTKINKVVVVTEKTQGRIPALRAGIATAKKLKSTWVAFSDSDANFSEDWAKTVNLFIQKNKKLSFGYSNEHFDESLRWLYPKFFRCLKIFSQWRQFVKSEIGSFLIMNNCVVKLSALEAIGGLDNDWATKSEDTLLTLKLLSKGFSGGYYHAPVVVSPRRLIESKHSMVKWCNDGNIKEYSVVNNQKILKPINKAGEKATDIQENVLRKSLVIKSDRIIRRLLILTVFDNSHDQKITTNLKAFCKTTGCYETFSKWFAYLPTYKKALFSNEWPTAQRYEFTVKHLKSRWKDITSLGGNKIREYCPSDIKYSRNRQNHHNSDTGFEFLHA